MTGVTLCTLLALSGAVHAQDDDFTLEVEREAVEVPMPEVRLGKEGREKVLVVDIGSQDLMARLLVYSPGSEEGLLEYASAGSLSDSTDNSYSTIFTLPIEYNTPGTELALRTGSGDIGVYRLTEKVTRKADGVLTRSSADIEYNDFRRRPEISYIEGTQLKVLGEDPSQVRVFVYNNMTGIAEAGSLGDESGARYFNIPISYIVGQPQIGLIDTVYPEHRQCYTLTSPVTLEPSSCSASLLRHIQSSL